MGFSRLSNTLRCSPEPDPIIREGEHSYQYEFVPIGIFSFLAPKCPKCRRKMSEQLVVRDINEFTNTNEIIAYKGEVCRNCDVLCENTGDMN